MSAPRVLDATGAELKLGRQLGAGGEGAVYEVLGETNRVAKLYHKPPPPDRAEKLRYMAAHTSEQLTRFAAWPVTTLHDRAGSLIRGFVMPRIAGQEIHVLYGVNHRRKEFPKADWRFLAHVAMNCAAVFEILHQHGYVIADVNQKNVVASDKATVGILDCDSFQMSIQGKLFRCEVGVAEYTPPELQGKSFKGVSRTPNHDLFGLAIHIFHLLFMGRHPFMGRFVGGDKALEDAIRECRFVYGRVATHKQMQPPPHSLPLSLVPPLIGDAFERAFSERSMTGGRPTAGEWQSLLKRLIENLKHCPSDKSHTFSSHLGACPWCAVVQNGGPFYFVTVQVGGLQFICGAKELEPLWAQVSQLGQLALAVPSPTIVPRTPSPLPAAVVAARRRSVLLKFGSIGAIAAAVMLFVASIAPTTRTIPAQSPSVQSPADLLSSAEVVRAHITPPPRRSVPISFPLSQPDPYAAGSAAALFVLGASAGSYVRWVDKYGRERSRRHGVLKIAERGLNNLKSQWSAMAGQYSKTSQAMHSRLEELKTQYLGLQPAFDATIKQLEAAKEQAQLREFLDDQYLQRAKIPKIGDGRKAILRGYGIETALDVLDRRAIDIPGFGPTLRRALLDWVRDVSGRFRFDPRKGVPESERRLRVSEYRRRQAQIEDQIRHALGELQHLTDDAKRRAGELTIAIGAATQAVMQARADVSVR